MKFLTQADRSFASTLKKVAMRGSVQSGAVEKVVRTILQAVQRGGDRAVLRYTKQFDHVALKAEALRVTSEEIKAAYHHIRKDEGDALRFAAQRVTSFRERQRTKTQTKKICSLKGIPRLPDFRRRQPFQPIRQLVCISRFPGSVFN